jgi:hypothetical protein
VIGVADVSFERGQQANLQQPGKVHARFHLRCAAACPDELSFVLTHRRLIGISRTEAN